VTTNKDTSEPTVQQALSLLLIRLVSNPLVTSSLTEPDHLGL